MFGVMAKTLVRLLAAGTLALALTWGGLSPLSERTGEWFAPQATVAAAATKQTVKLNASGGRVSKKSITVTVGRSYGKLPKPSRPFYKFAGWYTKKSGGSKVTSTKKVAKSVKTLYARWTRTNVEKMKRGVTYSVALNGSKKQKVKFTDKWGNDWADCTRTLYVNSKKANVGNCVDGWHEYTQVRVSSKLTLLYVEYFHEFEPWPGDIYRFDGSKLKLVKDLSANILDSFYFDDEPFGNTRPISAGSGSLVMRVPVADWLYDDRYNDMDVTYRYGNGKLTVTKVVAKDPSQKGDAGAAAAKFAKYCPGAVPGNTTDVSIQKFTHPAWGASTFVACRNHVTAKLPFIWEDGGYSAHVVVVDAKGKVRWKAADQSYYGEGHAYGWKMAEPATDSTGNLFVSYNPGRYDGIVIYRPTSTGMRLVDDFYYAELSDPDSAGRYRIRKYTNDCEPSCAGGTTTSRLYSWNGTSYV